MKIYQWNILSNVTNFATKEVHYKCGICNIIPNENQLKKRKEKTCFPVFGEEVYMSIELGYVEYSNLDYRCFTLL